MGRHQSRCHSHLSGRAEEWQAGVWQAWRFPPPRGKMPARSLSVKLFQKAHQRMDVIATCWQIGDRRIVRLLTQADGLPVLIGALATRARRRPLWAPISGICPLQFYVPAGPHASSPALGTGEIFGIRIGCLEYWAERRRA